jgi:RHH-type transcriptional regulator, proline utilization regulon repressor / proline dehydrogenase / delta 1-pyrroline-5-carboxylate dehydrogenase
MMMVFDGQGNGVLFPHALETAYLDDETTCVDALLTQVVIPGNVQKKIQTNAKKLVLEIRQSRSKKSALDAFMHQYDLSSEEGVALMCLAEAMLRVPDAQTVDDLIRDKLTAADWQAHLGTSDSFFVNASTWALMLTGKVVSQPTGKKLSNIFKKLLQSSGEPVVRTAVGQAMKILGKQFVMGRTIDEALKNAKAFEKKGYTYSYDMLGEAARTAEDAAHYFQSYQDAIEAIGGVSPHKPVEESPGISVKLSALHPRYEYAQRERVLEELTPKLLLLAQAAKKKNIGLTVDAEEARVLLLSLEIFERVYADPSLANWAGFGLAVQSYQKRAPFVIDWLVSLYEQHKRRIMVRLIKGAYWDSEIKYAQVNGLKGYPVFTRKASTDVSFLACARKLLDHPNAFYAQFGTHNAYSVAAVLAFAKDHNAFEFQCLHGMGHLLYDTVIEQFKTPCRIYAPVGGHKELLAYLVRRLLENGANTSFVNRIADSHASIDDLIENPVALVSAHKKKAHPKIPLPMDLFGDQRKNSSGIDLTDPQALVELEKQMNAAQKTARHAGPIISGEILPGKTHDVLSPTNHLNKAGQWVSTTDKQLAAAIKKAKKAQRAWSQLSGEQRADCLEKAADLLQARMPAFMTLLVNEAGKTLPDGVSEVREAIDFCRYYAAQAKTLFVPQVMPGPTGECNELTLHGRGVFLCISPWNFPLAIFTGQIVAALVTGNVVIAKPAEQTPLIANAMVQLLHEAGVPVDVLHLLPGDGRTVGQKLVCHRDIAGVMFTGSTETARAINQSLAARKGPIIPLIAETGGQNCMIVDSTALLEQVVIDVVACAFGSAGQRCSALRVLYIQEDIAPAFMQMLKGAMAELSLGDPAQLSTDVGPVIDDEALKLLRQHFQALQGAGRLIYKVARTKACRHGTFFPPCAFEIDSIKLLKREVFGPFLHVIRYSAKNLDKVIADICETGYGLTQGLHSRITGRIAYLQERLPVGNLYVNRNMIGAVVGVQPFGGEGLSGTGPKAGGPHYLYRLVTERVLTVDTTASGGNASLLTLTEEGSGL